MWNECKGFIALIAITLLVACLIIIGMFIQKEASRDLPRLKPREVSMNVGFAPMAQRARPSNYGYAQIANIKNPTNVGVANMGPRSYSYSTAPHAQVMKPTNVGIAPHARVRVYPKNPLITQTPEKNKK